ALGVVAGAMLLGDLPSAGSTGAFEGLVHLEADVRALLGRCLHGDPLQRPSAEDLHARLSTAGSGGTVRPLHHFVAWDALRGDTTDTEETVY
ncbi:MAG: hypothetical protein KC621_13925, partial [Myxococcales bacterium]|nr:hypothetical protein [Myxococcales bacterium]